MTELLKNKSSCKKKKGKEEKKHLRYINNVSEYIRNLWLAINLVFLAIEIQYQQNAAHDSQQVRRLSAKICHSTRDGIKFK